MRKAHHFCMVLLTASGALWAASSAAMAQPHCKILDVANRLGSTYARGGGPDGIVNDYDYIEFYHSYNAKSGIADIADFLGLTVLEGGGPDGQIDGNDINAYISLLSMTPTCDVPGPPPCSVFDIADFLGLTVADGGGPDGTFDDGDASAFLAAMISGSRIADVANFLGLTLLDGGGPDGSLDDNDLAAFSSFISSPSCPAGNRQASPADIADQDGLTTLDGGGPDGVFDYNDLNAYIGVLAENSSAADIADVLGSTTFEGGGPDGVVDEADYYAFEHHWNRGALPVNPRPMPVLAWTGTGLGYGDVPFAQLGTRAKVNLEAFGEINNRGPLEYARYPDAINYYGQKIQDSVVGASGEIEYAYFDVEVWLPTWDLTPDEFEDKLPADPNVPSNYRMVYDNEDTSVFPVPDSYYTGRLQENINGVWTDRTLIPPLANPNLPTSNPDQFHRWSTNQNSVQGRFAKTLWRRYIDRETTMTVGITDSVQRETIYEDSYNAKARYIIERAFEDARNGNPAREAAGKPVIKLGMYGYPVRRYPFGIAAGDDDPVKMRTAIRTAGWNNTVANTMKFEIERGVDPLMWMWDLQDVFMPSLYSPYITVPGSTNTSTSTTHTTESLRLDARLNIAIAHNARIKQGENKPIIPFIADFVTQLNADANAYDCSSVHTDSNSSGSIVVTHRQDCEFAVQTLVPTLWSSGVDGIIYWSWITPGPVPPRPFLSGGDVRNAVSAWWNEHFIPAVSIYPLP